MAMQTLTNFPFTINNHVLIASEMMGTRLRLNPENYELLREILNEEWSKCKRAVTTLAGKDINVGSPSQVQRLLYQDLGLRAKTKRGSGAVTSDENALRELRVQYPKHEELLNALIKERHIKKKIESYIQFESDEGGYIPYSANPAGTETNRWSFSKSPRGKGLNAQTLPKVMRLLCDAPDGRVFICPDLPQADARIVAWDAQCERLINLFLDPKVHFHLENAIRVGGLSREAAYDPKFKNEDPRYTLFKAMGHAANYRMQAKKLAMELGIEPKEATRTLEAYHRTYPEIIRWHKTIAERIRGKGGLRTPEPFNRWRVFYKAWGELLLWGKMSETSWNECCAHIPQSAVADIVNVGIEGIWKELPYVRFHLHTHDAYLASVPLEKMSEACEAALRHMKVELQIHGRPLTMNPEMSVGINYGMMFEWKGEREFDFEQHKKYATKKLDREDIKRGVYGYL